MERRGKHKSAFMHKPETRQTKTININLNANLEGWVHTSAEAKTLCENEILHLSVYPDPLRTLMAFSLGCARALQKISWKLTKRFLSNPTDRPSDGRIARQAAMKT